MNYYYAGIGSREAPSEILLAMTEMAKILEQKGYILRSGHAKGSDMAFEAGVQLAKNKEIFSRHVTTCEEARAIAASIHPAWHNCSDYAKGCHGRNIYQVLGRDLKIPVSFVICWTPEGKEIGGTRTAIVLAKQRKIPVYNLALENPCPIDAFVERITKNPLDSEKPCGKALKPNMADFKHPDWVIENEKDEEFRILTHLE